MGNEFEFFILINDNNMKQENLRNCLNNGFYQK